MEVSPDRGTYSPGQPVRINVLAPGHDGASIQASVSHLTTEVAHLESRLGNDGRAILEWTPPPDNPRGYGVDIEIARPGDQSLEASTAFDVLSHWGQRPRYGFVTDFAPGRPVDQVVEALLPFHINALQFYDWQYRHDHLVAPTEDYHDPLGRSLSLDTVMRLVQSARARGIGAMAYAAVYAASIDFQRDHPGWALHDSNGKSLEFEDFLGYMDPTSGRAWSDHLLDQCRRAITEVGFEGIHLDQYGEPRRAFDFDGDEVDLPSAFVDFIADLKRHRPQAPVTLNAVKNWPMDELAASQEDFYYVEVWSDTPSYSDLEDVVRRARESGRGKQVVVAIYIPSDREANILLVDSMILAAGGTRIELGEEARLLTDPYFPKHEPLSSKLEEVLLQFWDTAVRYGDVLFDRASSDVGFEVEAPDEIRARAHLSLGWQVVTLVNFAGLKDARWDLAHLAPVPLEDVHVKFRSRHPIVGLWWVNPAGRSACPQLLDLEIEDGSGQVVIPSLSYWGFLLFKLEGTGT